MSFFCFFYFLLFLFLLRGFLEFLLVVVEGVLAIGERGGRGKSEEKALGVDKSADCDV